MTTAAFAVGYLCGLVIIGMFAWIGVALHMAYTKMDLMLELLKNCSAVMTRAPLRHGGPWGKLLLVGGISGIVTFPGIYLKHGGVSTEDLEKMPKQLKRKLELLQWCAIGLLISLALFVALYKIIEAHHI
ncbi:hypothetical protein [Pseudomonas alkylphenolica]|uniref:Uncharacterized protein n=1 Tax=Pseudomonas alkylphenolica TaxID=237609 RepID=A0A077FE30_9PSED|nr:hypothetical protein [Pseudomonas alkylphenolica]AIL63528.1 hypothetical protein PSAKL28_43840 [Pseudomonas alkylphenolica]